MMVVAVHRPWTKTFVHSEIFDGVFIAAATDTPKIDAALSRPSIPKGLWERPSNGSVDSMARAGTRLRQENEAEINSSALAVLLGQTNGVSLYITFDEKPRRTRDRPSRTHVKVFRPL
jgi:hypothetical protein